MKLFAILTSVTFALAEVNLGTIYISHIATSGGKGANDKPYLFNVIVADDAVSVSSRMSAFHFNATTGIKQYEVEKYLNINAHGKFVFEDHPNPDFKLAKSDGKNGRRVLLFGGNNTFELCPDKSIGYYSKCQEGQRIIITFEEFV